jgi:hypothetical protein
VSEDRVLPRIRAIVGDKPFRMDWLSVYRFRCMMLERFVHGRVIFVGDSAHVVSPFGARGGNGGIQDADNLGWKLAAVVQGEAPPALIDSYDAERRHGAEENILNSARATGFMTPKSPIEAMFRSETLRMAHDQPFARELINSGVCRNPVRSPGSRYRPTACGTGQAGNRDAGCAGGRYMADLAGAGRVHACRIRRRALAGSARHPPDRGRADGRRTIPAMATGPVLRWAATGWVRPICSAPTVTSRRCFPRRPPPVSPPPATARSAIGRHWRRPSDDRAKNPRKRLCGRGDDDVYAALLAAHDGLSEAESHALNARLVLLMANRIGDAEAVMDLLETARSYAE